jgi:hypothetical protein
VPTVWSTGRGIQDRGRSLEHILVQILFISLYWMDGCIIVPAGQYLVAAGRLHLHFLQPTATLGRWHFHSVTHCASHSTSRLSPTATATRSHYRSGICTTLKKVSGGGQR